VNGAPRVGVCLDTCHLHAAGYDLVSEEGYRRTLAEFDRLVGLDRLRVLHLNDSARPLGSRVDRHAHIGQGSLGLAPFSRLLHDRRLKELPMLLETPKRGSARNAVVLDEDDVANLRVLNALLASGPDQVSEGA